MKPIVILFLAIAVGRTSPNNDKSKTADSSVTATQVEPDSVVALLTDTAKKVVKKDSVNAENSSQKPRSKVYANRRFKEVTVEKIGNNKFRVKGKGQIFEAAFSWVVEDGHDKIKQGHEMTDAGAPEWGKFDFVVEVAKQRPNSTLHLILFETSAKDGSRQYLLPIKLE